MPLENLFNVPVTKEQFEVFSWNNQDSHVRVSDEIDRRGHRALSYWPLDPIPFFDLRAWLIRHQQWHNEQNALLGTVGTDLTDIDFKDKAQVQTWVELHAGEHRAWENKLGIG